jgi:hypothetical protein
MYHICPVPLLERVIPPECKHHMCIANVVNSDMDYAAFYSIRRRRGEWITLDVGAFEDMDTTVEELWLATDKIKPAEIVLPDKFKDAEETCVRSAQAYEALDDAALMTAQFMIVPQGRDYGEYITCLKVLASNVGPRVHTVGIIEETTELYDRSRERMAEDVRSRFPELDVHLLGFMSDFSDVAIRGARSCDTGKLVTWGINGMLVMREGPWPDTYPGRETMGGRQGFFQYDCIDPFMVETARENVLEWSREI